MKILFLLSHISQIDIDIFNIFHELNKEINSCVDVDYEYAIKQKDKEINKLKTKLLELEQKIKEQKNKPKFQPVTEKPKKKNRTRHLYCIQKW